jgi:hypothetical protein
MPRLDGTSFASLHRFDGMLRTTLILIFMGLALGFERKDTPSGWYNFRLCHLKSMRRSLLVILVVVGTSPASSTTIYA